MQFGTGKSRDMMCRTAWRDTLVTTSATCTTRVQGHRTSVDWGGYVHLPIPEFVPEIDVNPNLKRLNFHTRALLLRRRQLCWNEHGATHTQEAQHARHDARDTHDTTRHDTRRMTSRACRVVSGRDATSGIWA